jgi:hypothetical protein
VLDPSAAPGTPPPDVWYGRPGSAAHGDPALYYVHIRSEKAARAFRPGAHGMKDADPKVSAAVLGVWAGDPVP